MIYYSTCLSKKSSVFSPLCLIPFIFLLSCATGNGSRFTEPLPIGKIENPSVINIRSSAENLKILILGDIHGYDFRNLVNDTARWNEYREKKTKAFDSSYENAAKVLEDAAVSDIDYIIIPGDVTVDGERSSHRMFASILEDFEQKSGKQVFIIPGNHDVNNPRARQFLEGKFQYTFTVKENEYADLYSSFGFSEAFSRDTESLSYAVEPEPGLILLCLDTNKFQYNFYFPFRTSIPKSGLKRETVFWISDILEMAKRSGKSVIAVQHHPLHEPVFKPETTVPHSEKIRDLYRKYGVSLVISAHRHRYYINSTDQVPQVVAPNISSTPAKALEADISGGRCTLTLNPFGYSE